jgi:hypothetical protein
VTGNSDCERVRTAGLRDSPHRLRKTNPLCHFSVAGCLSERNPLQFLPHALLKSGAAYVQWQIQSDFRGFNKANDFGDQLLVFLIAPK